MAILFYPHFVEELLRLREVDDLPKVTQPGRDGVRSHLAPKAAILPDPAAVLSAARNRKRPSGTQGAGKDAKAGQARLSL